MKNVAFILMVLFLWNPAQKVKGYREALDASTKGHFKGRGGYEDEPSNVGKKVRYQNPRSHGVPTTLEEQLESHPEIHEAPTEISGPIHMPDAFVTYLLGEKLMNKLYPIDDKLMANMEKDNSIFDMSSFIAALVPIKLSPASYIIKATFWIISLLFST